MLSFLEYATLRESDYCTGLSLNTDFFWDQGTDVSFLTVAGKDALIGQLRQAAASGRMNIVDQRLSTYGPNPSFGFSYLIVLGQSHMMVHTWPERHLMNLDVFTCGTEGDPHHIVQSLRASLRPAHVQTNQAQRGIRRDVKNAAEQPDSPKDLKPDNRPVGSPA